MMRKLRQREMCNLVKSPMLSSAGVRKQTCLYHSSALNIKHYSVVFIHICFLFVFRQIANQNKVGNVACACFINSVLTHLFYAGIILSEM